LTVQQQQQQDSNKHAASNAFTPGITTRIGANSGRQPGERIIDFGDLDV